MGLFRHRVRSMIDGKVVSVRLSAGRTRIAVLGTAGAEAYHFVAKAKARVGDSVKQGSVLGYV